MGRFISPDSVDYLGASGSTQSWNLFAYCENESVNGSDPSGRWAEKYDGFKEFNTGFSVNETKKFLSRSFCLLYASDIAIRKGKFSWKKGYRYKDMTPLRIAQEIWFHALVYYVGYPFRSVLLKIGISWDTLDGWIESAKTIDVNNDDDRAWVYKVVWYSGSVIKAKLSAVPGYRGIVNAIIL